MKYMKFSLLQTLKRAELDCVAELLKEVRAQVELDRLSVGAEAASTVDKRSISSPEEMQGDKYLDLSDIYDRTLF